MFVNSETIRISLYYIKVTTYYTKLSTLVSRYRAGLVIGSDYTSLKGPDNELYTNQQFGPITRRSRNRAARKRDPSVFLIINYFFIFSRWLSQEWLRVSQSFRTMTPPTGLRLKARKVIPDLYLNTLGSFINYVVSV